MKGNLKKLIGLLLAVTVMATCIVVTIPASAETVVWSEDFNDWTGTTKDDYTANGWEAKNETNFNDATNAALVQIDEEHGLSYRLSMTTGAQINKHLGLSSGKYQLDYSVYANTNTGTMFYMYMSGANVTSTDQVERNNVQPGSGEEVLDGNANALTALGKSGIAYFGSAFATTNKKWATTYETGKWYDYSIIVDMDTRLYKTTVKTGDTVVYEITRVMDPGASLNLIGMTSWNPTATEVYVDDFKVTPVTEALTEIVNDDFESYTSWDMTDDPAPSADRGYNNGYWGRATGFADGSRAAVLDNTTYTDNQTLAFFKDAASYMSYQLTNPINSGKMRIKFALLNRAGSEGPVIHFDDTFQSDSGDNATRSIAQYGGIHPTTKDINISATGPFAAQSDTILDAPAAIWYDWIYDIDLDDKTVTLTIEREGRVVARRRNVTLSLAQIAAFDITAWSGTADGTPKFWVDDLVIERVMDNETTEDYLIFENNFDEDGITTVDSLKQDGWYFRSWASDSDVHYEVANGAMHIFDVNEFIRKEFANETAAKIRMSYDISSTGLTVVQLTGSGVTNLNENVTTPLCLDPTHGVVIKNTDNWKTEGSKIADYTAGTWLSVEHVADVANKTMETTVKDSRGNLVGEPYATTLAYDGLKAIAFKNWQADTDIYLDNVKVEYFYGTPTLTENDITIKYISDIDADLTQDTIAPGVKSIALDFGTEIAKETANGAITIKNVDTGATVGYVGEVVGNTFVMTLTDASLAPTTKYEMTVPGTVATELGVALGTELVYEFETGKAECTTVLDGIYVCGEKKESLSGITSGSFDVKFKIVNNKTEDASYAIIVGYYDANDRMIYTDFAADTAGSGASVDVSKSFTLPDMTKVNYVKVFIWDSLENAMPYCEGISL